MRVYIEQTPQKNILKFVCDEIITSGSLEITSSNNNGESKLAQHLLQFPFVEKVFITANFVAVQKNDMVSWEDVAQSLKEIVNEHLNQNTIVFKITEKEPYTLYAEMTPNPRVMKFVSNQMLTEKMIELKSPEEAQEVPLAQSIFEKFDFIDEIFISDNYVSLTGNAQMDWHNVALEVRQFILDYLQSDQVIISDAFVPPVRDLGGEKQDRVYSDVEKEIQRILSEYIQPAVANDGGNISLVSYNQETKTATMLLQGACSGCPSSTMTLKSGIETILRDMMPSVVEHVEAVNG